MPIITSNNKFTKISLMIDAKIEDFEKRLASKMQDENESETSHFSTLAIEYYRSRNPELDYVPYPYTDSLIKARKAMQELKKTLQDFNESLDKAVSDEDKQKIIQENPMVITKILEKCENILPTLREPRDQGLMESIIKFLRIFISMKTDSQRLVESIQETLIEAKEDSSHNMKP